MGRVSVSERLLQTCYQFSLTARLAPKWNLLTYWLVQGKPLPLPCSNTGYRHHSTGLEFLSTGRAPAVGEPDPKYNLISSLLPSDASCPSLPHTVLEVGVTKTDMTLSIHVSKLNFNFLQVCF